MTQLLGTQIKTEDYRVLDIQALLSEHCIECQWINGKLWVLEISTHSGPNFRANIDEWIDATDWTKAELWAWLGY